MHAPEKPWLEPGPSHPGHPELWQVVGEKGPMDCSFEGVREGFRRNGADPKTPQVWWIIPPGGGPAELVLERAEFQDLARVWVEKDLGASLSSHRAGPWLLGALVLGLGIASYFGVLADVIRMFFILVLLGIQPFFGWLQARLELASFTRRPERYVAQLPEQIRFEGWSAPKTWRDFAAAWGPAVLWGILFVLQLVVGLPESVDRAALVKPKVAEGEYWRLLTGPMLHGSVMHLLMNGGAWISLAPLLGRCTHRGLPLLVWFAGALGGSLASQVLLAAPSVGASGGLCGLLGFLLMLGLKRRRQLPPRFLVGLVQSLLWLALFGVLAWAVVDNAGHGGGLVAGPGLGAWLLRGQGPIPWPPSRAWTSLELVVALGFLALGAFTALRLL